MKLKKLDTYVIDRSKWRCGSDGLFRSGKGLTKLLNAEGYMCCLGMTCQQAGVLKTDLMNKNNPGEINSVVPRFSTKGKIDNTVITDTKLADAAININDDSSITREERERRLKTLFGKWKLKLVFKGKYRD